MTEISPESQFNPEVEVALLPPRETDPRVNSRGPRQPSDNYKWRVTLTNYDKSRQFNIARSRILGGSHVPSVITMESTCRDKKFQSSWKLPPSSIDLDRKDSPVNPYYRSIRARMTCPRWTLPDADDQSETGICGLPEFEYDAYANSYMDACSSCIFSERTTTAQHRDQMERSRKEAYRKIKTKVENAVKVIFFGQ